MVSGAAVIRIHFGYRHVDKPWGGANNFIRALHASLEQSGRFEFTASIEDDCEILFMNQLGKGPDAPGKPWRLRDIEHLIRKSNNSGGTSARKLVVRAVNLNAHAFRMGVRNFLFSWRTDRATVALLNRADLAIFQSAYQRDFFIAAGYKGTRNIVIHNGADIRFWIEQPVCPPDSSVLRLVSSTASARQSKCHHILAALSALPGVEVRHLGAWPANLNPQKVRRLGMLPPEDMVRVFQDAHYMVHPAIKDPCPNAVFEAVCAGLPVIYNPGPGSSCEIIGECGFAFDENNLTKTLEHARRWLPQLRQVVLQRRASYRIAHAAEQYRRQFEQLA